MGWIKRIKKHKVGISGNSEKESFEKDTVVKNVSSEVGLEGSNGEPQPI